MLKERKKKGGNGPDPLSTASALAGAALIPVALLMKRTAMSQQELQSRSRYVYLTDS